MKGKFSERTPSDVMQLYVRVCNFTFIGTTSEKMCCSAPQRHEVQTRKLTFDCLAMTKHLGNASRGSVRVCIQCGGGGGGGHDVIAGLSSCRKLCICPYRQHVTER